MTSSAVAKVFLIAQDNLGARLFARHLAALFPTETKVHTRTVLPVRAPSASVILVSATDFDANALETMLESAHRDLADVPVALINPEDHERSGQLLDLLKWPNLAGMFCGHPSDDMLRRGIQTIAAGGLWLPRECTDYLVQTLRKPARVSKRIECLTRREQEVLERTFSGKSNDQIAEDLHVSSHTIKTHLYNAYRKLGVKSRYEAFQHNHDSALVMRQ